MAPRASFVLFRLHLPTLWPPSCNGVRSTANFAEIILAISEKLHDLIRAKHYYIHGGKRQVGAPSPKYITRSIIDESFKVAKCTL